MTGQFYTIAVFMPDSLTLRFLTHLASKQGYQLIVLENWQQKCDFANLYLIDLFWDATQIEERLQYFNELAAYIPVLILQTDNVAEEYKIFNNHAPYLFFLPKDLQKINEFLSNILRPATKAADSISSSLPVRTIETPAQNAEKLSQNGTAKEGGTKIENSLIVPTKEEIIKPQILLDNTNKIALPSEHFPLDISDDKKTHILLADDSKPVRNFVTKILTEQGYSVTTFENGRILMDYLENGGQGNIILLDNQMPEMGGIETLRALKAEKKLAGLPVLFLSAITDKKKVVEALELGADDYMEKPFNNSEFLARINVHLRIDLLKRKLYEEKEKSDRLLLNTLPRKIVRDLKQYGKTEPETFNEVTVFFSDIVSFTKHSSNLEPKQLIKELNEIFTKFDIIMEDNHCERIKTIGDAYFAVCGMPQPDPNHAKNIVQAAIEIQRFMAERYKKKENGWQIRIGIHTGRVVGGIVGVKKYLYDLFGDTINTASRMESNSLPMHINLSAETYKRVSHLYPFIEREPLEVKGKGSMKMYFLNIDELDKQAASSSLSIQPISFALAKQKFTEKQYSEVLRLLQWPHYTEKIGLRECQLIGAAHYHLKQYEQCLNAWQQALAIQPNHPKILESIAKVKNKIKP